MGIRAEGIDFYSLFVTLGDTVRKYVPRLGKVSAGKGCIRFKSLADLNLGELDAMVKELRTRTVKP